MQKALFLFFFLCFAILQATNTESKIINTEENATLQAKEYNTMGLESYNKGKYDEAINFFNKSLKITLATLGENHPYTVQTRNSLAYAFNSLASSFRNKKQYNKAIDYYTRALILHKKILKSNPERYGFEVLEDINRLIETYQENDKPEKAQEVYEEILKFYTKLFEQEKKIYGIGYVKVIIKGVERSYLDKDVLDEVKTILSTLSQNTETKGLLLQVKQLEERGIVYVLWVLGILMSLWLIWYFKHYKNTMVLQLQREPKTLLSFNPIALHEAQTKLSKINELESLLKTLDIEPKKFTEALAFFDQSPEQKVAYLAESLDASYVKEGEFYRLSLGENFPLHTLNSFLVYVDNESANKMHKKALATQEKILVLGSSQEQNSLAKMAGDKSNFVIAPTVSQLNQLLMFDETQEMLVTILSHCLYAKNMSPYQINGDVKNAANFFGRVEILRDILSNHKNYLIVGSRQLGKSSVLHALQRRYEMNPNVNSYLFTLRDANLLSEMQEALGLDESHDMERIVSYLSKQEKRSVFLIDEADEFIEADANNDYKMTKAFRKLAQDGKATFVITGFWTLYYYVTQDYHAPLKNFGELIKLGGLEDEACRELMIEPMKRVGVSYDDEEIISKLIKRCGNRANLIAITCHEALKVIEGSVIRQADIEEVIRYSTLEDYLKGWQHISRNEEENTLDRAILFLTLKEERFRLSDVLDMLASVGLASADENKVDESLDRLVIGYFLEKDRGDYSYRVPLFREKLLYEDIETRLKREVRKLGEIWC